MTSESATPAATGRRLGMLLAGYLLLVIGTITLAPFTVRIPAAWVIHWLVRDGGWAVDILLNVVLFLPLGMVAHRSTRWPMRRIVLVATAVSVAIEGVQLFVVPRYTTVSDVAANAAGAFIGAWLSRAIDRRIDGGDVVGRLLLDLPLMGLVYVMVPLLWLAGLASSGHPERVWLMLPVGAAGGLALAAIATSIPTAGDTTVGRNLLLAVAAWFGVGAVPALRINPVAATAGLGCAVAMAAIGRVLWSRAVVRDRRLEPQVVRVIVPLMLAYVVGATIGSGPLAFAEVSDARVQILRWLARFAAFATVGYLIGEWRGRRREGDLMALVVPAIAAFVVATLVAIPTGTSVVTGGVTAVTAAAFGGTLYRRQRDHVIALKRATGRPS